MEPANPKALQTLCLSVVCLSVSAYYRKGKKWLSSQLGTHESSQKMALVQHVKSRGKQRAHGFHIKLFSTLRPGSPGKNSAPTAVTASRALCGLPAAVQMQVYFRNWLPNGGVGCQHFPQAGRCHTCVSGTSRREFLSYTKEWAALWTVVPWTLLAAPGDQWTIFYYAFRVRHLLRRGKEVEVHRPAFVSMVSKP